MHEEPAETLAEDYGCHTRVFKRDGKYLGVTADLNRRRIDVAISHGVVTEVGIG